MAEWSKAHAWKACRRQRLGGSNPSLSAIRDFMMINVFIDSDLGVDDWCAISFLARSKNINIVGLSITGCGESYLTPAIQNTLNILDLLQQKKVPIGIGASSPSSFSNVFPKDFRNDISNLLGYSLPKSSINPKSLSSANKVLSDALNAYPDLTYLSIGGLTNLYHYLINCPEPAVPQYLVSLCGAINVRGNINTLFPQAYPNNEVAEWNVFIDPKAAEYVINYFQSNGLSLGIVPLDACYQVPLTQHFLNQLVNLPNKDSVLSFIEYVLSNRFIRAKNGGFPGYLYDQLAAWILTSNPESTKKITGEFYVNTSFDNEENDQLGKLSFKPLTTASSFYYDIISSETFYKEFVTAFDNHPNY